MSVSKKNHYLKKHFSESTKTTKAIKSIQWRKSKFPFKGLGFRQWKYSSKLGKYMCLVTSLCIHLLRIECTNPYKQKTNICPKSTITGLVIIAVT